MKSKFETETELILRLMGEEGKMSQCQPNNHRISGTRERDFKDWYFQVLCCSKESICQSQQGWSTFNKTVLRDKIYIVANRVLWADNSIEGFWVHDEPRDRK